MSCSRCLAPSTNGAPVRIRSPCSLLPLPSQRQFSTRCKQNRRFISKAQVSTVEKNETDTPSITTAEPDSGSGPQSSNNGRSEQEADAEAQQIQEQEAAEGRSTKVSKSDGEITVLKEDGSEIYLGYAKGADRSKPGRVIKDDPSRYPERSSTTGGWAGGEKGLQAFVEEEQQRAGATKTVISGEDRQRALTEKPKVLSQDGETIYLGFDKGTIIDDPRKYPSKEAFGLFDGITGGFAGGELGLQQYVENGELKFAQEGGRSSQLNILGLAALIAVASTVGGVLLTDFTEVSEEAVRGEVTQLEAAPLDDNTKLLLQAALVLFGFVAVGAGARAGLRSVAGKVTKSTLNLAKLVLFTFTVYVAARFILES